MFTKPHGTFSHGTFSHFRHLFRELGTSSTCDDRHEVFDYDALNRLEEADHLASERTLTTDSDVYGNLTVKTSDVSGDLDVTSYSYPTSANPTRLASVSIGGVSNTLVYDAIGNITRYNAVSGDDTYIAYDAANRATEITVGASETTATPTARDEFWYGVDEHRILKRSSWDDAGQQESRWDLYLWGQFEQSHSDLDPNIVYVQRVRVTETTQHRHKQKTAGTAAYVEYLHRDHLGSVTAATYYNGSTLFEAAYDPFGSRREADGTADLPSSGLAQLQVFEDNVGMRGFTDHEHLDRTGFIHMNGRVFDPRIGRFIQPDPIVQAPAFSQSYNRYAYVFNSPLSYTDPSGFVTACTTTTNPETGFSSKSCSGGGGGGGLYSLFASSYGFGGSADGGFSTAFGSGGDGAGKKRWEDLASGQDAFTPPEIRISILEEFRYLYDRVSFQNAFRAAKLQLTSMDLSNESLGLLIKKNKEGEYYIDYFVPNLDAVNGKGRIPGTLSQVGYVPGVAFIVIRAGQWLSSDAFFNNRNAAVSSGVFNGVNSLGVSGYVRFSRGDYYWNGALIGPDYTAVRVPRDFTSLIGR